MAFITPTVKVREWKGEVILLHEVASGVADRSYGIQVAKLAGLPQAVTERAAAKCCRNWKKAIRPSNVKTLVDDLPLFSSLQSPMNNSQKPKQMKSGTC